MAQVDKFTAFLKPGNSWVMQGGKKVGQKKKGATITNTSISGRASISKSGKRIASNSGKGNGGKVKAPTMSSSGKNLVNRLKSGNLSGAAVSAKNLKNATKKAVKDTVSSKASLAKIKYKPKARAVETAVKSAYAKVDTKAERKTIFRKFKRKATDSILGKDTGGRNVKRTGGAVGTLKSWGSAAQKAAIKKLADFNRGRKRKNTTTTSRTNGPR